MWSQGDPRPLILYARDSLTHCDFPNIQNIQSRIVCSSIGDHANLAWTAGDIPIVPAIFFATLITSIARSRRTAMCARTFSSDSGDGPVVRAAAITGPR